LTTLLVDASVLIKWFQGSGEAELAEARAIRDAHQRGELDARIIALAMYEVGNVLLTRLRWAASDISSQLDDIVSICGTPLVTTSAWLRDAAVLGETHQLTFHDAAWAAAARGLGIPLVSADAKLIAAGLADSPAVTARRLRLR
jgi:predicted nucleic acid-binding protein